MSEPGLTTPVQRVQPRGGRGAIVVGVTIVLVVGLLAWHPWAATRPTTSSRSLADGQTPAASLRAGFDATAAPVGPDASTDPDLFRRLTAGPWSGRVTAEWSIVAFLRSEPVPGDPLNLRQQQVAVMYGQPESVGLTDAICDQEGYFLHRAAADLPTREVRYLGIAYPPEESVAVRRITRLGQTVPALPVELGRIPGLVTSPPRSASDRSGISPRGSLPPAQEAALDDGGLLAAGGTVPAAGASPGGAGGETPPDRVRMYALAGGGTWPDGVYRFDVSTHEGLPTALFACIGS